MNIYAQLKQFQDDVERMTGVRPAVNVSFHTHGSKTDEECSAIRNFMAGSADGALSSEDVPLDGGDGIGHWTMYGARSHDLSITVNVHGPHTKEAVTA